MATKTPRIRTDEATITGCIESAFSDVSDLAQEMQDWYDNMPENLQGSSKGEMVSEASDTLGNYTDAPSIPDSLNEIKVTYSYDTKAKSRAARRDNAMMMLGAAIEGIEKQIETLEESMKASLAEDAEDEREERRSELQELVDELDNAKSDIEGVEFPGMY